MPVERHIDPWEVLGIPSEAPEAEAREAYLRLVKIHPPESDPEGFERVRDAWERIRDPRRRVSSLIEVDPKAPIAALLDTLPPERRFTGPKPWLAVIAEGAKRT